MTKHYKTAKTIKEYRVEYGRLKYQIVVPVGYTVSNRTALGYDDSYRFLISFKTEDLVGYKAPMLAHDLTYYGLNIPAEYCEPYPQD